MKITRWMAGVKALVLLAVVGLITANGFAQGAAGPGIDIEPKIEGEVAWYDVRHFGVEGKGFEDTECFFDRLPSKAKGVVRDPVWDLSRDSTGMCARFETDGSEIRVRYTLISESLSMPHMPATGVSGLDLYAGIAPGKWHWLAVARPGAREVNVKLASGIAPGRRAYLLYLPLYNGVESLEIGVVKGAGFTPLAPRKEKPVVFYGTSITQGGCASRPGMVYTAILGRRLGRPVINLGFSGNGRMEPEVGALLGELDPCIYVIDCLPNMNARAVAERAEPLVRQLRKAHPEVPILLVEDRTYSGALLIPAQQDRNSTSRAALKEAYGRLIASGIKHLHYLEGEKLLGDDGEGTVDGSHPTDLGMMRYADALEPVLRAILSGR